MKLDFKNLLSPIHIKDLNAPCGIVDILEETSLRKPCLIISTPDFLRSIKSYLNFKERPFNELPFYNNPLSLSYKSKHSSWKTWAKIGQGLFLTDPLSLLKRTSLDQELICLHPHDPLPDFKALGYIPADSAETKGSFSERGYVLDLFSPAYSTPLRIELSGDRIVSLHLLDGEMKKRAMALPKAFVPSLLKKPLSGEVRQKICEFLKKENVNKEEIAKIAKGGSLESWSFLQDFDQNSCFLDSFSKPPFVLVYRFQKTKSFFKEVLKKDFSSSALGFENIFLPWEKVERSFLVSANGLKPADIKNLKESASYPCKILKTKNLNEILENPKVHQLVCLSQNEKEEQEFKKILSLKGSSLEKEGLSFFKEKSLIFLKKKIKESWINEVTGVAYVLTKDFIPFTPSHKNQTFKLFQKKLKAYDFSNLRKNELIIHRKYGIGAFNSLQTLTVGRRKQDFFVISYKKGDKLLLPGYKANEIKKYSENMSFEFKESILDSLGNQKRWEQKKEKAKKHIREMTMELLTLYQKRVQTKRPPYAPCNNSLLKFSNSFPFEETATQKKAITETLQDMDKDHPMERLLCADVGFGKTEVALRATLRAIESGFQVCFLAPTTVLSLQHYENFKQRFKDWPIKIVLLNRFTKEKTKIYKEISNGNADLVIATHQVLNPSLHFKNLSLCIIDEEHRFGVKHKEHFKKFNKALDVLFLSATPLPRTLNMALSGLKDISVISDPPKERKPVKTFIKNWNDIEIQKACCFEKERGGQILFIHNRIRELKEQEEKLKKILPNFKIAVAHGRLKTSELESLFLDFFNKKFDLLLCTTLIESGLDMPEANTLFINKPENLGLGQIYQLKGRVGRGVRQAYCYFLVSKTKTLSSIQEERLELLERHKELGSGFHLALHDLETRGAGEIFGAEQSGHLSTVGQELYFEFLNSSLNQVEETFLEPEIKLPFSTCLPESFLPDSKLRLLYYKNLSEAKTFEDLFAIKEDLQENFGFLPEEVLNLFFLLDLRNICLKLLIRELKLTKDHLYLIFDKQSPLPIEEILKSIEEGSQMQGEFSLKMPLKNKDQKSQIKNILEKFLKKIKK